jgi:hypothetical protein
MRKKVILDVETDVTRAGQCGIGSIYVTGIRGLFYKAHRLNPNDEQGLYAFVSLDDSHIKLGSVVGLQDLLRETVKAGYSVYQYSSFYDFIQAYNARSSDDF